MPILDIFPEPDEMKIAPLFLMMSIYGYILCKASAVIGDGSEMLMLIFGPGIVGGLVIPILGAIPDCAVILISGMGAGSRAEVQNQLAVGVGTLVGSTIMLLTIPWGLGVYLGRRKYNESKDAAGSRKCGKFDLFGSCVTMTAEIPPTSRIMIASLAGYLVIQIPSFFFTHDSDGGVAGEHPWALACLIFSVLCFVFYCGLQVYNSKENEITRQKQEQARHAAWKKSLDHSMGQKHVQELIFKSYDKDNSGYMDAEELSRAMAHLGLQVGRKDMKELMQSIDVGHHEDGDAGKSDGKISLKEFQAAADMWVSAGQKGDNLGSIASSRAASRQVSQRNLKDASRDSQHAQIGYGSIDDSSQITKKQKNKGNSGSSSKVGDKILQKDAVKQTVAKASGANKPKKAPGVKDDSKEPDLDMDTDVEKGSDAEGDDEEESDDEGGEEEEEYWELSDTELLVKASLLLLAGTLCVTIFSDPMVDVITQVGDRLNVSPFYIAFIVTPLASNASEVYAGLLFAKKKTNESISMTLATLHGAATMNSTLALSIFMCIIYFRGLQWSYTAEVTAVIVVVTLVGLQGMWRRNVFLWQGLFVLSLYPLSILIVYTMQAFGLE